MYRRRIRIIFTVISLAFTVLGMLATFLYGYMNQEYYLDIFKRKDILPMINIIVFGTFILALFIYTIIRLISRIAMSNKRYYELTKYQPFGFLYIYAGIWTVLIGYLVFATLTLQVPLATFPLVIAIALLMVVTIIYYLDTLAPNDIKDRYMKS